LSAAALDLDGDGQAPVARRGDLGLAGLFDAGQAHAATSSGTAGPHLTIRSLKRRLTRISPGAAAIREVARGAPGATGAERTLGPRAGSGGLDPIEVTCVIHVFGLFVISSRPFTPDNRATAD
jgi:hypothetical protein